MREAEEWLTRLGKHQADVEEEEEGKRESLLSSSDNGRERKWEDVGIIASSRGTGKQSHIYNTPFFVSSLSAMDSSLSGNSHTSTSHSLPAYYTSNPHLLLFLTTPHPLSSGPQDINALSTLSQPFPTSCRWRNLVFPKYTVR